LKSAKAPHARKPFWGSLLGWVLLFRVRFVGVFFLISQLFSLIRRRRWAGAIAGTAAAGLWLLLENSLQVETRPVNDYAGSFFANSGFLSAPLPVLLEWAHIARENALGFAGSFYANFLFPFFYNLHPMNPVKRAMAVGIFVLGCAGAALLWKREKPLRPILFGFFGQTALLFVLRESLAEFRYFLPFLPLMAAFLVFPLERLAQRLPHPLARKHLATGMLALLVAGQAAHSLTIEEFDPYLMRAEGLAGLHRFLQESRDKPDLVLSPRHYYTYLQTGLPVLAADLWTPARREAFRFQARSLIPGRSTWLILEQGAQTAALLEDLGYAVSDPIASEGVWSLRVLSQPTAAAPAIPPAAADSTPIKTQSAQGEERRNR
jgi:hypothetical protein